MASELHQRASNRPIEAIADICCKTQSTQEVSSLYTNKNHTRDATITDSILHKRYEEALRKSDQKYRDLIETANSIIMTADKDLNITYMNEFGLRFFGYEASELIGKNVIGTTIPQKDDEGRDLALMAEDIRLHPIGYTTNVHKNMRRDGSLVWVSWTNKARCDENGKLVEILAIGNDITQLMHTRRSLKESEEKYRRLHESISDAVVTVDMSGRFCEYNQVYLDMLGYSAEEMAQLTYRDITPEKWHAFEEIVVKEQIFARGFSDVYQKEYRRKDGTMFPVELRTYLIRDEAGNPTHMWATIRDITERKQAEEALRQSEIRFRVAQELSPDGFTILRPMRDEQGRVADFTWVYANAATERTVGMKLSALRGRTLLHLFPGHRGSPFLEAYRQAAETGKTSVLESLYEGDRVLAGRWFRIAVVPMGQDIAVLSQDITERKRTEEALCEREREFVAMFEGAAVGKAQADPQTGRFLRVNQAMADLTGYSREELCRMTFSDITHPDDRQRDIECFEPIRLGTAGQWQSEKRYLRKDGAVIWVQVSGNLLTPEDGSPPRSIAVIQDITSRKQAEEALRESEQRFRLMVDAVPYGAWHTDAAGYCTYVSPSFLEMCGMSMEELQKFGWMHLLPPEDVQPTKDHWMRCVQSGENFEREHRFRTKDNGWRHVLAIGRPVRDQQGQITSWVGLNLDITARKQAEELLRQNERELEQRVAERTQEVTEQSKHLRALASQLSRTEQKERKRFAKILHDHIQQSIVAARMQLSSMKGNKDYEDRLQELDAILKETLDATRSLSVDLIPPVLHQSGLIAALGWLATRMREKNGFTVHVKADNRAEPASEETRFLLFECVRELLFNSVKHSGVSEAHVMLSRLNAERIQLIVFDKGRGFEPDMMKNLCAGETTFGLFSIRERLTYLGGQIKMDTAPGKGACFTIIVESEAPRENLDAQPQQKENQPHACSNYADKSNQCRVIICDDHKIVREGLAKLLQFDSQIKVVGQAHDGISAVELAQKHQPDAVIMDVNMNEMDGVEATRRIVRINPKAKIIGLSMHEDPNIASAMHAAGAFAFLSKTGPSQDLIELVKSCCQDKKKN